MSIFQLPDAPGFRVGLIVFCVIVALALLVVAAPLVRGLLLLVLVLGVTTWFNGRKR